MDRLERLPGKGTNHISKVKHSPGNSDASHLETDLGRVDGHPEHDRPGDKPHHVIPGTSPTQPVLIHGDTSPAPPRLYKARSRNSQGGIDSISSCSRINQGGSPPVRQPTGSL